MMNLRNILLATSLSVASLVPVAAFAPAIAASSTDLDHDSAQALRTLYKSNPLAEKIGEKAAAILVFPNIVKAGLVFGGSYGEGTLMKNGDVEGYYNSVSASWGLQAGAQSYGYGRVPDDQEGRPLRPRLARLGNRRRTGRSSS